MGRREDTELESALGVLGRAALQLAAGGYAVFPLRPNGKLPLLRAPEPGKGGFHQATFNRTKIIEWWLSYPEANIAIRTGGPFGVVDVDPKNGGVVPPWCQRIMTPTVRTASGGWHFYVRLPEGEWPSRPIAKGVDLKADRGYVVAPPSVIDGSEYYWVRQGRLAVAFSEQLAGDSEHGLHRGPLPETIPAGTRNDGLCRWAGAFRAQGQELDELAENLLAVNDAYCDPPCPEEDVLKIARWAATKPVR